ncbi:hypothetical protein PF010_g21603 [Phytophthora fragariae]|uniref:Uncharacterized protein n=1 Tax=Phytophthora fragariae TaxID=53985 RepID=A0A6A3XKE6_9STRA|nr:hypothetical protein PF010_g21603 [Phytophthora fragariae]KAE9203427.1 hypothetical protein PF002_g20931 [Phytophthora fragariae]
MPIDVAVILFAWPTLFSAGVFPIGVGSVPGKASASDSAFSFVFVTMSSNRDALLFAHTDPLDSRFPKQGPADPTWVTSLLTNGLDGAEVRADQSLTVYQALDADLCQELDEQRAARSWTSTSKLDADIELDCNNQRARQELDADLERGDGKLYTHIQLQGLRPRSWPLRNALVCAQVEEVNRSKSSRPGLSRNADMPKTLVVDLVKDQLALADDNGKKILPVVVNRRDFGLDIKYSLARSEFFHFFT